MLSRHLRSFKVILLLLMFPVEASAGLNMPDVLLDRVILTLIGQDSQRWTDCLIRSVQGGHPRGAEELGRRSWLFLIA